MAAAAAMVLGLVPATAVGAGTNLLSNPGFDSALGATQTEGTANPSFGNWTAYNFRPAIPAPAEVGAPNPVHGGQASGEVRDPAGIGSAFFYQDLSSFDPNSTYTISAWVYPESGEQGFDLEFGWDRGSQGNTTGSSSFGIGPAATGSSAWGQSISAAPVTYKAWHHVQLVVNGTTFTSELYVDGTYEGTSPAGQQVPSGSSTTLLVGYGSAPASETRFFWDDLEITAGIAVGPPGGHSGIVGEWRGNGNASDTVGTNNGTLIDGGYGAGPNGQAFALDGADDYVTIPSAAMAGVTGAISVSALVNPVAQPAENGEVVGQYDTHDNATAFDFSMNTNGHLEWFVVGPGCDSLRGDARTVETTSPIPAGQWTQIAGTYDPATEQLKVFVNGQQAATQMTDSAKVPALCRTGTPLRIGAAEAIGGELGAFFHGEIQDVQLYNTDISGGGGSVGGGGPPPLSSPCVAGPGNPPHAVVILITGIGSELPATSSYDPLRENYCGLAQHNESGDLADLAFMAHHSFDQRRNSGAAIAPIDLTDALGEAGAVLLPFSYDGVSLTQPAGQPPLYQVGKFDSGTPGAVSPSAEADGYLLALVHQAHRLWRDTPIYVIGHSEGGLVAEQLFERHSLRELAGVARIVSLDSPLNGTAHGLPISAFNISSTLFNFWNARWNERESLDHRLIRRDEQMGEIYEPLGTEGDPVYALGNIGPFRSSCPSLESQLLWVLTPCEANGKVALLESPPSHVTPEPAKNSTPHWPAEGVSGTLERFFAAHEFVMQSAENIAELRGMVEAGRGASVARASRADAAVFSPDLAAAAVASSSVDYTPAVIARLQRATAAIGGTVRIVGSGLGSSPGAVELVGERSTLALPVIRWGPDSVTASVPAHARSGLVSMTTAAGQAALVGVLGVSGERHSRVRLLRYARSSRRPLDGQAATIGVRALDAHGRPVRSVAVDVLLGDEALKAVTNARGMAWLRLVGFGCESAIAFSGATSTGFRVCWHEAPHQTIVLKVLGRHRHRVIAAKVKAHGPVRDEAVRFHSAAGSCAHLERRVARTNAQGVAAVRLTDNCGVPVLVEATTNHDTLVGGVLVAS